MPTPFTAKQGQYLAFIYYYSKIHGIAPAEADLRRFFRVTPPVVHQMIKMLHASVRPVAVVMLHKDVEDPPKMLLVQDPQPVENGCKWVSRASPKSRRETLPDGISRSQSHRWQTVATVPAPISLNDVRPIRLSASQSLSVAPSTAPRRGLARPLNLLRAEGTFLHGASSFSLGF